MMRCVILSATVLSVGILWGCAAGGSGDLSVREAATALPPNRDADLAVPASTRFRITKTDKRAASPIDAAAEADAKTDPAGSASAHALAANEGEAWSYFQLGHPFENDDATQRNLELTVEYDFDFRVIPQAAEGFTAGGVTLDLKLRNRRTRGVSTYPLLAYSADVGPAGEQGRRALTIPLTFAPNDVIDVYLFGRANAEPGVDDSVEAKLSLSDVQMRLGPPNVLTSARTGRGQD